MLQGRYTGILVQKESYLLELVRYVLLNPVRARMVKSAGQWPWSSYRVMIGRSDCPHWLAKNELLSQVGSSENKAQRQFIEFIQDGRLDDDLWSNLRQQMYLGDEKFVEQMHRYCEQNVDLSEIIKAHYSRKSHPIEWYEQQYQTRNEAIVMAFRSGGFTQRELADNFNLHYSNVSRILKRCSESVH